MSDTSNGRVLVVDDKQDVLTAIRLLLKEHVNEVHTTRNPATINELMRENTYDVVLLDMNFQEDASSGREGFAWLQRILDLEPQSVVIMITAYGDVDKAVRAMKEGAADFITKPWENERLRRAVRNGIKLKQSRVQAQHNARYDQPRAVPDEGTFEGMLGKSEAMQEVYAKIDKVARTDANILVLGENGTGKELVACAIHRRSHRSDGPFVTADLASLSESLFESELFGHVKGAFTGADADRTGHFEKADGGTLFLDEIGNVPASMQPKLLTVLQRREIVRVGSTRRVPVDLRLVSATNQPLYKMVGSGHFRQDLLYRLNTVEINLPPLRDRGDDIKRLATYFCSHFAEHYDRPIQGIHPDAMSQLNAYAWPGNVRELKHTMERAVILAEDDTIYPDNLSFSAPGQAPGEERLSFENLDLESIEQAAVRKALSKHGGNISRASRELGISRKALYRRIEKYGL